MRVVKSPNQSSEQQEERVVAISPDWLPSKEIISELRSPSEFPKLSPV